MTDKDAMWGGWSTLGEYPITEIHTTAIPYVTTQYQPNPFISQELTEIRELKQEIRELKELIKNG